MSDAAKAPPVIELSTLYFCEGNIPSSLALKDCALPIAGCAPNAFSALYGHQSKQDGFMAARDFAEKNRLQFTVIDFFVTLDFRINPGLMKEDELSGHDFIAFQRLARSGGDAIKQMLLAAPALDQEAMTALDSVKPASLLLERPDLLSILLSHPSLQHMKVIAHQARPLFSGRAMNVGTVPFQHWGAIKEATCRLNPTTRVTLDTPQQTVRSAPVPVPVPAHVPAHVPDTAPAQAPRAKPRVRVKNIS